MKKFICGMLVTFLVLIACVCVFDKKTVEKEVINIPKPENASISGKLEARFLNMLNHNYVYNDSFNSVEEVVNCSIPALLNLRDKENEEYIAEYHIVDYVYNMYGIEIMDMSEINGEEQKSGYVYIIPRGFDDYKHTAERLVENEDGSYTLYTRVTVSDQYGEEYVTTAKTLFVKNDHSDFGYNVVYSKIY